MSTVPLDQWERKQKQGFFTGKQKVILIVLTNGSSHKLHSIYSLWLLM